MLLISSVLFFALFFHTNILANRGQCIQDIFRTYVPLHGREHDLETGKKKNRQNRGIQYFLFNPVLVCLLGRDIGDTSQGHLTFDGGPRIGTGGPWSLPTRLCQERIGPRLLGERSRANK